MKTLKKELIRFVIAGVSAVTTDLLTYYILLNFINPNLAKGISFLTGTIVAYLINKYWTFEKKNKSYSEMIKFGILYGCTLGLNVYTNKLVLELTELILIAFIVATGVSTVLNFLGQKFWVFK